MPPERLFPEVSLGPGWVDLEDHLIEQHGADYPVLEPLDTDALRRLHLAMHALGTFAPGHRHSHA